MAVTKLRRIEDARRPPAAPLEGDNLRAAFGLSALCRRLHPWAPPRGVHRNHSIDQAQARRRAWEAAAS